MLKIRVIESIETAWAAILVFTPSKDGFLLFCVGYRRLHAVIVCSSYLIPKMHGCIDSLGDSLISSTLERSCIFWHIEMDDKHRDKTSFISHHRRYRFSQGPFWLCIAPGTFQRIIYYIFSQIKWPFSLQYSKILSNCQARRQTCIAYSTCSVSLTQSWCHIEVEEL